MTRTGRLRALVERWGGCGRSRWWAAHTGVGALLAWGWQIGLAVGLAMTAAIVGGGTAAVAGFPP